MLEKVREVLVETANVDPEKVVLEASLKDDLDIDSLDSVEIVLALESEFDVKIDDSELQSMLTVGDIISLLDKKLN